MHACMYASHSKTPYTRLVLLSRKEEAKKEGQEKVWGLKLEALFTLLGSQSSFFSLPWQLVQLPKSKYIFVGRR